MADILTRYIWKSVVTNNINDVSVQFKWQCDSEAAWTISGPETEAAKCNSDVSNCIIDSCAFPRVSCNNWFYGKGWSRPSHNHPVLQPLIPSWVMWSTTPYIYMQWWTVTKYIYSSVVQFWDTCTLLEYFNFWRNTAFFTPLYVS